MPPKSRGDQEAERLIRRLQAESASSPQKSLPIADQLKADLARYRPQAPHRRFAQAMWAQMTAPSATNPVVGMYIRLDAAALLEVTDSGAPTALPLERALSRFGETEVRKWSAAAVRKTPARYRLPGEDVRKAYAAFAAAPLRPATAQARKPPRGAARKSANGTRPPSQSNRPTNRSSKPKGPRS